MSCNAEFKLGIYYNVGDLKDLPVYESTGELSFPAPIAQPRGCKKCVAKNLSWTTEVGLYGSNPPKWIRFEGEVIGLGRFYKMIKLTEAEYEMIQTIRRNEIYTGTVSKVHCKVVKNECGCSKPEFKNQKYFVYKVETEDDGLVHFYFDDDLEKKPNRSGFSDDEQEVFKLRQMILDEGYKTYNNYPDKKYLLSPSTIALVILTELNLWDFFDTAQTKLSYWDDKFIDPNDSYGYSQVMLNTLADMIKTGHYPSVRGFHGNTTILEQRKKLFIEANKKNSSPKITAGFLRKVIEHWQLGSVDANAKTGKFIADYERLVARGCQPAPVGFDISEKPGVVATLYQMGIGHPVHDRPGPNEHYTSSIIEGKLETIESKMGIPSAPPRFLNKARFSKLKIISDKIEFVEHITQNVDIKNNSFFTDSRGRSSRYMHPVSVETKLNCRKY